MAEEEKDSEFQEIELEVVTTLATLKQALSKYSEAMEMFDQVLPTARANKEKHSYMWLANHVASCAEIHRKSGDLEQAKVLHTGNELIFILLIRANNFHFITGFYVSVRCISYALFMQRHWHTGR